MCYEIVAMDRRLRALEGYSLSRICIPQLFKRIEMEMEMHMDGVPSECM